jgi:hypothetical protein
MSEESQRWPVSVLKQACCCSGTVGDPGAVTQRRSCLTVMRNRRDGNFKKPDLMLSLFTGKTKVFKSGALKPTGFKCSGSWPNPVQTFPAEPAMTVIDQGDTSVGRLRRHRLRFSGALTVRAPRPAARAALSLVHFFQGATNTPLARGLLFCFFNPADELVATEHSQ